MIVYKRGFWKKSISEFLPFEKIYSVYAICEQLFYIGVCTHIQSYSTVLDKCDFSILSIPEGIFFHFLSSFPFKPLDQFSLELYDQHNALYSKLVEEQIALEPFIKEYNQWIGIQNAKKELTELQQNPDRYKDKRNSHKM